MRKLNIKGITVETVTGVVILVIALVNAVLQMFGLNTIPIVDSDVSGVISTVFLIVSAFYNAYKNRNITTASQKAQEITDAIKSGEILVKDVEELLNKIHKE